MSSCPRFYVRTSQPSASLYLISGVWAAWVCKPRSGCTCAPASAAPVLTLLICTVAAASQKLLGFNRVHPSLTTPYSDACCTSFPPYCITRWYCTALCGPNHPHSLVQGVGRTSHVLTDLRPCDFSWHQARCMAPCGCSLPPVGTAVVWLAWLKGLDVPRFQTFAVQSLVECLHCLQHRAFHDPIFFTSHIFRGGDREKSRKARHKALPRGSHTQCHNTRLEQPPQHSIPQG